MKRGVSAWKVVKWFKGARRTTSEGKDKRVRLYDATGKDAEDSGWSKDSENGCKRARTRTRVSGATRG